LGNSDENELALTILTQASQRELSWIGKVSHGVNEKNLPALFVEAPAARMQEITAFLAQRNLYLAEAYLHQNNLEDFFLDLTGTSAGEGSRAGMTALVTNGKS
jgi:hypothetical protein